MWKGAVLSFLYVHPPPSWALLPPGSRTRPCCPWPSGLLLGLESPGPSPQGGWGRALLPQLGDRAGPGSPSNMKRRRLLTTPRETWKVMEGLGGVSAEAGDLPNFIREAGVGRAERLPAPAWGQGIGFGQHLGRGLLQAGAFWGG